MPTSLSGNACSGCTRGLPSSSLTASASIVCSTASLDAILRASFRKSLEKPEPIEPDKIYAYDISIWPTSNLFKAGHRIRLEISSSNFPHYDRNPNTGHPFGQDAELCVAQQTILHDRDHPSHVLLAVAPPP